MEIDVSTFIYLYAGTQNQFIGLCHHLYFSLYFAQNESPDIAWFLYCEEKNQVQQLGHTKPRLPPKGESMIRSHNGAIIMRTLNEFDWTHNARNCNAMPIALALESAQSRGTE
ncbi:MAG: hypothetical protein ABIR84_12235 [Candidatus Nitrotoga sp.]